MEPKEKGRLRNGGGGGGGGGGTADLSEFVSASVHGNSFALPLMDKSFPVAEHSNQFISVQPDCLVFHSYRIGSPITRYLHIINIAGKEQRFHILPLEPGPFSLQYEKKHKLLPGTELSIKITFLPEAYTPLMRNLYIHCPGEQNLTIPITACPSPNLTGFPKTLHFPNTAINSCNTIQFDLTSDLCIPFSFVLQFRPATDTNMTVIPASGIVPPEGCSSVRVCYKPTSLKTTMVDLELTLPDIDSNIRICSCSGSCLPTANKPRSSKGVRVSATQQKRRVVLLKHNTLSNKKQPKPSPSKLTSLDKIVHPTLHLQRDREREFLNDVHLLKETEKMNQLRWSTTLGEAGLTTPVSVSHALTERDSVSSSRQLRSSTNSTQRELIKVERSNQERRPEPDCLLQESLYQASINWGERRESLHRFLLVAKRIVIQLRAQIRLERIQKFLKQAQAAGLSLSDYEKKKENSELLEEEFVIPDFKFPSVPFVFIREGSVKVGFDVSNYPFIDIPAPSIDFTEEEPYFDIIAPLYYNPEHQIYPKIPLFCPETAHLQGLIGKKKPPNPEYNAIDEDSLMKTEEEILEEEEKIIEQAGLMMSNYLPGDEEVLSISSNSRDRKLDAEPSPLPSDISLVFERKIMESQNVSGNVSGKESVF